MKLWKIVSPFAVRIMVAAFVESVAVVVSGENAVFSSYMVEISTIAAALTIPVFLWMMRKDNCSGHAEVAAKEKTKYLLIIGISISIAIALNVILLLANSMFPDQAFQEASMSMAGPSAGMQLLSYGIVFPVMEECLFRGLFYRRLKDYLSYKNAMLLSAVCFGIYHGNMVQGIYAMLSGLLFVFFFEKFKGLKGCIAAHISMNVTVILLSEFSVFDWIFKSSFRVSLTILLSAVLGIKLLWNCHNSKS